MSSPFCPASGPGDIFVRIQLALLLSEETTRVYKSIGVREGQEDFDSGVQQEVERCARKWDGPRSDRPNGKE